MSLVMVVNGLVRRMMTLRMVWAGYLRSYDGDDGGDDDCDDGVGEVVVMWEEVYHGIIGS